MSFYIELLGYIGSFVILVSLTMKSIIKLRWINAAGSLLFVIFAILTKSTPTVVMNAGIIIIDLWYVYLISKTKADYQLINAERDSALLQFFYKTHSPEIIATFGETAFSEAEHLSYFLCNGEIAGLFAWKKIEPHTCLILIDYVTVQYRDTKIGSYFFDQQAENFKTKGFSYLKYKNVGEKHWKYLKKIGFTNIGSGDFSKHI